MEWIQIIAAVGTILVSFITLLGSIYGMMKFLLKDVTKEIEILKEAQAEFRKDLKENQAEFRKEMKSYRDDMKSANARMDGVYHLMLDGKFDLARKKLHES